MIRDKMSNSRLRRVILQNLFSSSPFVRTSCNGKDNSASAYFLELAFVDIDELLIQGLDCVP